MAIWARWRRLENLPPKRGRDAQPGVYELADVDKNLIYIGQSAKDVPNRIRQHLQRESYVSTRVVYWRYFFSRVPQAEEAALLAAYKQKNQGELPPCNRVIPKERSSKRRYSELSQSDD